MAFRKISYLIPACDGCGLAWSFGDPGCADGIPPHFADASVALRQLPDEYGWQLIPRRLGRPLMACRRCATTRAIPAAGGRARLLAVMSCVRRQVPFGPLRRPLSANPAAGHAESMTAALPPEQEELLAVLDAEIFSDR